MTLSQEFPGFNVQLDVQPQDEFEGFDVQFLSEQKEPLKPVSEFVRQPLRIGKAVSARIGGLPGNVQQLLNAAGDFIQSIPEYVTPASVSESLKKRREKVSDIMSGFTLPTSEEIAESQTQAAKELAQALGYDLDISPQSALERITEDVIGGAAEAPLFGAARLPFAAFEAGSGLAREAGFGLPGQLAAGAAGLGLGELGQKAASLTSRTRLAKQLAKESGITEKQIRQSLIDAAKAEGVELPATAMFDNAFIQNAYAKAFESPLSGEALKQQVKEISADIVNKIKTIPAEMKGTAIDSFYNLGSQYQDRLIEYVNLEKKEISKLYNASKKDLEPFVVKSDSLINAHRQLIKDLENTLIQGTEKTTTINQLKKSLETLEEAAAKPKFIKLKKTETKDLIKGQKALEKDFNTDRAKTFHKEYKKFLSKEDGFTSKEFSDFLVKRQKLLKKRFATEADLKLANQLSEIEKELTQKIVPKKGNFISVNTLIETMKDINNIINYEQFGGVSKTLLEISKEIKTALKPFKNSLFGQNLAKANKRFAELAKTITTEPEIAKLLKTKRYDKIVSYADIPERFDKLMKVLPSAKMKGRYSEKLVGQEVAGQFEKLLKKSNSLKDDFRKTLVENAIVKPLYTKSGDISLKKAANVFKDAATKKRLKNLLGQKQFKSLENLQKIAGEAGEALDKFRNFSGSGTTLISYENMLAPITSIIASVSSGSILPLIASPVAKTRLLKMQSEIFSNPKYSQLLIDLAKANKTSNPQKFLEKAAPLISEILRELGKFAQEENLSLEDLGIEE